MRLPPHPLSFIQIGDKGFSHRGEFVHHVLVAIGESLVIAAMTLLEEGVECLAVLNRYDSFGNAHKGSTPLCASIWAYCRYGRNDDIVTT